MNLPFPESFTMTICSFYFGPAYVRFVVVVIIISLAAIIFLPEILP